MIPEREGELKLGIIHARLVTKAGKKGGGESQKD